MYHKFVLFLLLFLCSSAPSLAQEKLTWDGFVNYVYQWMDFSASNDEQTNGEAWVQHLEDLQPLTLHPINLNTASREELLLLPFLTEVQIDDIRSHVQKYRGMLSLNELRLIPSLTAFEIRILPLFVSVEPIPKTTPAKLTLRDMLKQHRHELLTRLDIPLYYRDGYMRSKGGYQGSPIYNKVRYDFSATQHIRVNLHTERDAGERGIDSYGGAFMLKDIGHLATLVVGDFKAGFGEGLVINQAFSMGKSGISTRVSQGLRMSGSTDEYNFLRGAGFTLRFGNVNVSAFGSYRRWDATLTSASSSSDGSLSSDGSYSYPNEAKTLITDGYHRTATESSKKHNLGVTVAGANASWSHKGFHAGASGYYLHTALPLNPGTQQYRKIYPHGQHFGVMGINYGYETYRWWLRGETAFSTEQQGIATLNSASLKINNRYRLTASQRYYSRHYYSFFAAAVSDNGKVQNETAASLRMDATPTDGWQLSVYFDAFYNPWPRYGLTSSSNGFEGVILTQYSINRNNTISARYSFKDKQYSSGRQQHHRLRMQWHYTASKSWNWQTTAMLHALQGSTGAAIGEVVRYGQKTDLPLHASASLIYFYTHDYNSRIYLYEPNVVGTLSIPSFYGHGIRMAGTLQWSVWQQRLRLELKYGFTGYFDRTTQSSSLQTIYSRFKNDITLQVRFRI